MLWNKSLVTIYNDNNNLYCSNRLYSIGDDIVYNTHRDYRKNTKIYKNNQRN